jgi:hypothetical protein
LNNYLVDAVSVLLRADRLKMDAEGLVADRAEQIKWWNAMDMFVDDIEEALRVCRDCRHPDAQWLVSLVAPGETLSKRDLREVLLQQGDDPRALHLVRKLRVAAPRGPRAMQTPFFTADGEEDDDSRLRRAAEMGYAPAQSTLASMTLAP